MSEGLEVSGGDLGAVIGSPFVVSRILAGNYIMQ
jgi:hypothetical protein